MNITINNATVASAGADQTTCGTSSITLAANATTGGNWTGGAGSFAPDRNTANAIYTPAVSEIGTPITLTWNVPDPDGAGPCTAATDQMNITINNATVASAGADQTTCGASSITLAANATTGGNWTGGAGTFAPDRNTANATYTPAISEIGTTITLTWNVPDPDGAGPCNAATDQMNITINNATVASAGADQTTCGASSITLAANTTTGGNWTGGAGSFAPDRNTANATYTPAISEIGTTITLTWNVPDPDGAGPCNAATDQMNITINNATVASAGADQTTCGASSITLAANTTTGGNWTGGAGSFAPDRNTANATYTPAVSEIGTTITLTWNVPDPDGAGPCTAATDQMNITINNATVASAGADQTTCGASSITLAANATTGGNWTGGTGTFNPNRNTANATYTPAAGETGSTITLTWNVPDPDGAGPCTAATDQMNITINNATVASAGADQTTCGASSITLAANATTSGNWTGGTGTFNPNRNTANATYTPAAGEIGSTITLTWNVPDPDGVGPCTSATDAMTVTINANCCVVTPGSISGDQSICRNVDPDPLTATTAATGSGTLTYRWERSTTNCSTGFTAIPGATSNTYDPPIGLTQTTYFRRVAINTSGSNTCEAISNCVIITIISGPQVNQISSLTYCVGSTAPAIVFSSNVPGATIQWSRTAPIPDIGLIPVSGFGLSFNVPSFTATNTTSSPLSSTFTVVATNDGCAGAPMQFTITVVPRPTVTLQLPLIR
jgi:CRISPR/Cas system CSM-associated protein Csm4 (group 5 of RAMP superfamily)